MESLSVSDKESEVKEKKLLGRKIKGDTEKRKHDKFRPDNKMRKVKSNFVNLLPDYVNSSLSMEHPKFLKISKKVNEELSIDYNKTLINDYNYLSIVIDHYIIKNRQLLYKIITLN